MANLFQHKVNAPTQTQAQTHLRWIAQQERWQGMSTSVEIESQKPKAYRMLKFRRLDILNAMTFRVTWDFHANWHEWGWKSGEHNLTQTWESKPALPPSPCGGSSSAAPFITFIKCFLRAREKERQKLNLKTQFAMHVLRMKTNHLRVNNPLHQFMVGFGVWDFCVELIYAVGWEFCGYKTEFIEKLKRI